MDDRIEFTQRGIAVLTILVFVGMGLFPPWLESYVPNASSSDKVLICVAPAERPTGYGFLFDTESSSNYLFSGRSYSWGHERIDVARLAVQWIILLAVTVPWYLSVRDPKGRNERKDVKSDFSHSGEDKTAAGGAAASPLPDEERPVRLTRMTSPSP
jgi:hypothetical protein